MRVLAAHTVPAGIAGLRLSDYAVGVFEALPSRKSVKKAIKRGAIWVDGRPAGTGHWVASGQRIELRELREEPPPVLPLVFPVLYEDDDLAVIRKPAGLPVSGNQYRTVERALLHNLRPTAATGDALAWPHPVHRLDAPTSGLLLIAKTATAEMDLRQQFAERIIQKRYQAVVMGDLPATGRIEDPLDGKEAITAYRRLERVPSLRSGRLCLTDLFPLTGRTHQLRRHLSGRGYPILGDKEYGAPGHILLGKGLFLSAVGLSFLHPRTGAPVEVAVEAPAKFQKFMAGEERRWRKYQSR